MPWPHALEAQLAGRGGMLFDYTLLFLVLRLLRRNLVMQCWLLLACCLCWLWAGDCLAEARGTDASVQPLSVGGYWPWPWP